MSPQQISVEHNIVAALPFHKSIEHGLQGMSFGLVGNFLFQMILKLEQ
jgi:hypothetical protein